MKKFKPYYPLLFFPLLLVCLAVRAQFNPAGNSFTPIITVLQNYGVIGSTNAFTASCVISNVSIPPRTLAIQTGGLATTNTLYASGQVSFDNTNFVTVQGEWITNMASGVVTFVPNLNSVNVYFRAQLGLVTTTNNIGVQAIQQNN